MSMQKVGPGRSVRSVLLLVAIACLPQAAAADTEVPASVAALLPAGLEVESQEWGVFEHEFGKVISGQFGALFTGSVSCDWTMGPRFDLALAGDNAWEASPEQLAMWEQMFLPDITQAYAQPHSDFVKKFVQDSYGELVVGEDRSEQLPNGHITYTDFTWKCPKNPGGENVRLSGYAHRGTTVLTFSFWANASSEAAVAMAKQIFAQFDKLDIAALYALPPTGN